MNGEFVIWSLEHRAWWRAASLGYSETLAEAGTYSREEARDILSEANLVKVNECMVPVAALTGASRFEKKGAYRGPVD